MAQDFTVDRNSSKWVLGSDGFLKEYANDEAAIEFNADGSYKGVLVEPESTNNILYSNTFSNSYWRKQNLTVSSESNSKFGTIYKVTDSNDGLDTYHFLGRISNIVSTGTYNRSVFVKKGTLTKVIVNSAGVLSPETSTSINGRILVDLTDGSIVDSNNADNISVREYGDDWYRISYSRTISNTPADGRFSIVLCSNDATDAINDQTYQGDGTGYLYVFGAQLEESPIATSYIPTTTGAVTRLKDDIFFTNASSVIGQSQGTLFVEVDWQLTSGATQWIFSINDSTFTNRVLLLKSAVDEYIDARVYKSGSAVWNEPYTISLSGIQKIALTYSATGGKMYINGSEVLDDANDLSFSAGTLTDVDFGQSATSSGQANMWIRAVALFTTRLSDAECEALTTL